MSLYFALLTVENNKNKKSVKFQGDMLNYCDFIQVFVFTTNHHLNKFLNICPFKCNFKLFFCCKQYLQPKSYQVNTLEASKLTQNDKDKSYVSAQMTDTLT